MKKYIKPNMEVNTIEMENMIAASDIKSVSGIEGLGIGDDDFEGGYVDSKNRGFDSLGELW